MPIEPPQWWVRVLGCLVLAVGLASGRTLVAAEFSDAYSARQTLTASEGVMLGSNQGASREPGEPRHAGKSGGHSVWVRWVAPADGLMDLSGAGSSFDIVLGVYKRKAPEGPGTNPFADLETVIDRDDDDGPAPSVQWPVRAGESFDIAIDGFGGTTGSIELRWKLFATGAGIPVLSSVPADQALTEGTTVTLSIPFVPGDEAEYRWLHNGAEVDNGESATLVIRSFRQQDVGRYRLRIKIDNLVLYSATIELQINSEGQGTALARNKLLDAVESPLRPEPERDEDDDRSRPARLSLQGARVPSALPIGVVRGLNGTQIFSTADGTRDADEPQHCGVQGGASYWFGYQCIEAGKLRFDSSGSEFPTVVAVYTFDPPLVQYSQLVALGCDVADGVTRTFSVVEIEALPGRTYFAVLDGVNGARGRAHLNYQLTRPVIPPPVPPAISGLPGALTLAEGAPLELSATVTGSSPLVLQWARNGKPIPDATNAVWSLPQATEADSGAYVLSATNLAGSASSPEVVVRVLRSPRLISVSSPQTIGLGAMLSFAAVAEGSEPLAYQWFKDGALIPDATNAVWSLSEATLADAATYSVRVTNEVGTVQSPEVALRVLRPPTIENLTGPQQAVEGTQVTVEVNASGDGPLTFQWMFESQPLPTQTTARLVLDGVRRDQAGAYTVEVVGPVGRIVSSPWRLEVVSAPTLSSPPTPQTVGVGGQATFTAAGDAGILGSVQWFKDGLAIAGAVDWKLRLTGCAASDAGRYWIEITNPAGLVRSDPVALDVRLRPHFDFTSGTPTSSATVGFVVRPGARCNIETAPGASGPWTETQSIVADASGWLKETVPIPPGDFHFVRCVQVEAAATPEASTSPIPTRPAQADSP